jgi:hypothetical protein
MGQNDKEMMVLGDVSYKLENGKNHSTAWAARYSIVKDGGKLKFKKVQIILVSLGEWYYEVNS